MDSFTESPEYKELRRRDNKRKEVSTPDTECRHELWSQKCGLCGKIMKSDSIINCETGEYHKIVYHELEPLVCSFKLAVKLQEEKVVQRSKFFWVHHTEHNVLTLRTKDNTTLKGTVVASAFTVAEICKHLYRLPKAQLTDKVYSYIGQNGTDPDRLARLLLKEKRKTYENRVRR